MSVFTGVLEHLIGERTLCPVSHLILLVHVQITVVFEKVSKTPAPKVQSDRCVMSVKQVYNVNAEITLQPKDVIVSTVKDFDNIWIIKDASECITEVNFQSYCVHDVITLPCGYLHERCDALKSPIAMVLQVNCNFPLLL